MKQVTFVELPIYEQVLPLVSGYLQAYACKDSLIANSYRFQQYSVNVKTPPRHIIDHLVNCDSDVYAFSCYVWNSKLVKRILAGLIPAKPNAYFILGGPQVMHHAHHYLDPQNEQLVLCNGEGEQTFAQFLSVLTGTRPDFERVQGLSFYREHTLVTNAEHSRIRDLNDIPSPYLQGLFEGNYRSVIYETNRGCPFSCGFCYWGAATNDKVFRFDEQRIREELDWITHKHIPLLLIADANWGIFPRDIDFTKQIAHNAKTHQAPYVVFFSASKNKPDRACEITEILDEAGVAVTHPISLQTLSDESLVQIDRENIKLDAYLSVQKALKNKAISTYTELIWPLPGETLASFMAGISTLCAGDAGAIFAYSHILLNNTPLYHQREHFGLVTQAVAQDEGEVELVVETRDVSRAEYELGLRYYYAVHVLHNLHVLALVGAYVHNQGLMSYSELFMSFAEYLEGESSSALSALYRELTEEGQFYAYGEVAHAVLHEHREHCRELLQGFVSSQSWWSDERAQLLFELDLLNQPYIYGNTEFGLEAGLLRHVEVLEAKNRVYTIEVPSSLLADVMAYVPSKGSEVTGEGGESSQVFRVDHNRSQFPYVESRGVDATYCFGRVIRAQSMLPTWNRLPVEHPAVAPI